MIKHSKYGSKLLVSMEIDGVPYASMKDILNSIIPGAWPDYEQVISNEEDMRLDLNIKYFDGMYLVPVTLVSCWLYAFSLKSMSAELYERFRVFRRDVEKVLKVTWALPVEDLFMYRPYVEHIEENCDRTLWDLNNIFSSYGISEDVLEGYLDDDHVLTPLEYIDTIASSRECGSRGALLSNTIQYAEDMPCSDLILSYLNQMWLWKGIPPEQAYLDDYLDTLNVIISGELSRFVGELNAQ